MVILLFLLQRQFSSCEAETNQPTKFMITSIWPFRASAEPCPSCGHFILVSFPPAWLPTSFRLSTAQWRWRLVLPRILSVIFSLKHSPSIHCGSGTWTPPITICREIICKLLCLSQQTGLWGHGPCKLATAPGTVAATQKISARWMCVYKAFQKKNILKVQPWSLVEKYSIDAWSFYSFVLSVSALFIGGTGDKAESLNRDFSSN